MELKENLDILSWQGVLGRKAHFRVQVKIVGYALIAMIIPFILMMVERVRTFSAVLWFIGVGVSIVVGALYVCLSVVAYWKRIRDIRGTMTDEG